MYAVLNTIHSYNRYLILVALAFVLFRSIAGWLGKKPYEKPDNIAAAALLGLCHLQLLLGLILYFISPRVQIVLANWSAFDGKSWEKYFAMEHAASMFIAIVLIQLGRTFSKRAIAAEQKHRTVATYTIIAVLLIVGTLAHKGLVLGNVASATGN